MSRTLNFMPVFSAVLSVSVSISVLVYAAAVFAQEAAAPPIAATAPTATITPLNTAPAQAPDVKTEPAPLAPAQITVPPAAEPPVSISAPAVVQTPEPVAPKPVLTEAEKKKLRSEIVYRSSLGRAPDVKILLEKGASADETNDSGTPIIALASSRSDNQGLDIIKNLLEAGADINKVDSRGKNALFYAAKAGNRPIVEYLLAKKIKFTAVDSSGYNARSIAFQTGNNEIVEVLDNFVLGQNAELRKESEEINKEIADKIKKYNDKISEQIKKETNENEKIKLASSKTGAIQGEVYGLAFSSCSASYWEFCNTNQQQTQFGAKDIISNINTQNSRARESANNLIKTYYVNREVVQNIMTVSGDTIKAQLAEYDTNAQRADDGVGTVEDMTRRCSLIADTWQATPKKSEGLLLP